MNNRELRDGEPCSHPGCLHHISKPCEGCGRVGGRSVKAITTNVYYVPPEVPDMPVQGFTDSTPDLEEWCGKCHKKRSEHAYHVGKYWCVGNVNEEFESTGLSGEPINLKPYRPKPQVHNCGDAIAKDWIGGSRDLDPFNAEGVKAWKERDRQAAELLNVDTRTDYAQFRMPDEENK